MKTIEYIKKFGLEVLEEKLGIVVRKYPEHRLMVLNYSQIESPKTHEVVVECRGLILHMDTLEVVSRSFDRFLNYGENGVGVGQTLDGCQVFEKMDGSLIKIYRHNNRWEISTRGTAFAESDCNGFGSFRSLVLSALRGGNGCTEEEFQEDANFYLCPTMTYIYELTAPENRVVTQYDTRSLTLLATRENSTGVYGSYEDEQSACMFAECHKASPYTFSSIDQMILYAKNLPGLKEGFVVYKNSAPWFKCKSPMYVTAHHIRGEGLTHKRAIQLVLSGEVDEYLTYFKSDATIIEPYTITLHNLLEMMEDVYDLTKHIEGQKEFAQQIKDHNFASCLFGARKNNTRPTDEFYKAKPSYQYTLLDQWFNKEHQ